MDNCIQLHIICCIFRKQNQIIIINLSIVRATFSKTSNISESISIIAIRMNWRTIYNDRIIYKERNFQPKIFLFRLLLSFFSCIDSFFPEGFKDFHPEYTLNNK